MQCLYQNFISVYIVTNVTNFVINQTAMMKGSVFFMEFPLNLGL